MGTRADFYDTTTNLVWLGSIAWDGDAFIRVRSASECSTCVGMLASKHDMFCRACGRKLLRHRELWDARSHEEYLAAVEALKSRDDWTSPEQGWPWPWKDSNTTDCVYAWGPAAARVDATVVSYHKSYTQKEPSGWYTPQWYRQYLVEHEEWYSWEAERTLECVEPLPEPILRVGDNPVFPDMTDRQNVTLGSRSGVMLFERG